MEGKRYEGPIFFMMLPVILGLGFVTSMLDPTSIASGNGAAIEVGSLSSINRVLIWVGICMVLLGIAIRFVAIITLKKNFSGRLRIREDHTLIKIGIYRWVRHPAYLGAIVLFLGFPVMLSSVFGFLVMFLIVPLILHRIRLEERMLIERFGSEYEEYTRRSKKLVPFVY
jgi:protein-S-isoprenylcysteine O-methyltransferase Ste14